MQSEGPVGPDHVPIVVGLGLVVRVALLVPMLVLAAVGPVDPPPSDGPNLAGVSQGDSTPPSAPGTPSDGGTVINQTSVTWTWTAAADAESGISDYRIDIGTTPGSSDIVMGTSTAGALSYNRTGLSDGVTYYARVRAVNGALLPGAYSGNSDGILIDVTAPTISTMTAGSLTTNSTAITWTTNEAAGRLVRYGTTSGSYPSATAHEASGATSHRVTLSGLAAGTTYYYQVVVDDAAGNTRSSSEGTFATMAEQSSPSPTPSATTSSTSPTSSATTTSVSPTPSATTSLPAASNEPSLQSTTTATSSPTVKATGTKITTVEPTQTPTSPEPSAVTSSPAARETSVPPAAVPTRPVVSSHPTGSARPLLWLILLLFLLLLLLAYLMWRRSQSRQLGKVANQKAP